MLSIRFPRSLIKRRHDVTADSRESIPRQLIKSRRVPIPDIVPLIAIIVENERDLFTLHLLFVLYVPVAVCRRCETRTVRVHDPRFLNYLVNLISWLVQITQIMRTNSGFRRFLRVVRLTGKINYTKERNSSKRRNSEPLFLHLSMPTLADT